MYIAVSLAVGIILWYVIVLLCVCVLCCCVCFFFQAEDGIRDLVRSRGLGDVYKRQLFAIVCHIVSLVLTLRSSGFTDFYWSTLLVAVANGTVESLSLIHI